MLCVVVAIAAYYVGYALVFLFLSLREARRPDKPDAIGRKLFRPIVAEIDKFRGELDPEKLRLLDRRMLRNTPPKVLLTVAVLFLLGWLIVTCFRYLLS